VHVASESFQVDAKYQRPGSRWSMSPDGIAKWRFELLAERADGELFAAAATTAASRSSAAAAASTFKRGVDMRPSFLTGT
jgi:hypothetical protein